MRGRTRENAKKPQEGQDEEAPGLEARASAPEFRPMESVPELAEGE